MSVVIRKLRYKFFALFSVYLEDKRGTAALEAALLLPVMMVLLMGVFDIGRGIVVNQKAISASQVAADLLARNKTVNAGSLEEAIQASKLSLQPNDLESYGVDIVSVEFDEYGEPQILWRETRNMSENDVAVDSTSGLAPEGEGMIIVTVTYAYEPFFSAFLTDELVFTEVAFTRGRRSPTVTWEG